MKKLYILILFASTFSLSVHAQLILTKAAHEPVAGDSWTHRQYDSLGVVPKSTGTSQLWNFSSFIAGTFTETTTFMPPSSAPGAVFYPSATLSQSLSTQPGDAEFWGGTASTMEYLGGYQSSGPTVGSLSNTIIRHNWPVAYASTNFDSFSGTEISPTSTVTLNGTFSYTATGTGTVILPGSIVHPNCLQVVEVFSLSVTQGTNTSVMVERQYRYFSSLTKLPILEVSYSTSNPPDIRISFAAFSVGIKEHSTASADFIVYPNPASDHVNVFLENKEVPISIEVIDMLGRTVASSENSSSVITSTLSKGVYSIRVKAKEGIGQKSLVISE